MLQNNVILYKHGTLFLPIGCFSVKYFQTEAPILSMACSFPRHSLPYPTYPDSIAKRLLKSMEKFPQGHWIFCLNHEILTHIVWHCTFALDPQKLRISVIEWFALLISTVLSHRTYSFILSIICPFHYIQFCPLHDFCAPYESSSSLSTTLCKHFDQAGNTMLKHNVLVCMQKIVDVWPRLFTLLHLQMFKGTRHLQMIKRHELGYKAFNPVSSLLLRTY